MPAPDSKKNARVSQQDIAREAGVSRVTVSLVLSGKDETSPETRQRVLDAARKLRYRPNLLVQGMQTGRTGTVGVIAAMSFPFQSAIAHGIHDELVAAEVVPMLLWADAAAKSPTAELGQIHRLIDRRVDGMIIWPQDASVPDVHFSEIWERGIPLVTVDRETTTQADHVGTDEELGGRLAAEHLLKLGHRQVVHLTFPLKPGSIARRRESFVRTLKDAGVTCEVIETPNEDVSATALSLLTRAVPPTAIFTATDPIALKVYAAAAKVGLKIPDDLSVVGYADFSFASELIPPLTTIRQDAYTIGRTAAKMLLERIHDPNVGDGARRVRLKPELIQRGSTARSAR